MPADLMPYAEVWPAVTARLKPIQAHCVPLLEAAGRVLRRDAVARWDLPTVDNSAMDGFAVRAQDAVAGAVLRVVKGDAYAGTTAPAAVQAGAAARIGTGGVLPPGADAVVPKENARAEGDEVTVTVAASAGDHVRRAGEELHRGAVVAVSGQRLDPLRLAAAAMAGVTEVTVSRTPVVEVLTSGDEVVPLGTDLAPGQVVDSNGPFLRTALEQLLGAAPPERPALPDERPELRRAFGDALDRADLVLVTGGVSVGDRDLVKPVLEEDLGVERLLWRVAQKPGKPVYVGLRDGTWVVGLPGNPGAVAAMWFVLVRPLLLALMGAADPRPRRLPARLAVPVRPNRVRTHLRWCRSRVDEGGVSVEPLERSGSHMLSDFSRADCLAEIPPGDEQLPAGSVVQALALDR